MKKLNNDLFLFYKSDQLINQKLIKVEFKAIVMFFHNSEYVCDVFYL